jgi:hypothetical protein
VPKEKGVVGAGLECSAADTAASNDADVKVGLKIGRAGFRACTASAGAGVIALGNEKVWVVTLVEWVSGFGHGAGMARNENPNPRNEFIAPLKSSFCRAG